MVLPIRSTTKSNIKCKCGEPAVLTGWNKHGLIAYCESHARIFTAKSDEIYQQMCIMQWQDQDWFTQLFPKIFKPKQLKLM